MFIWERTHGPVPLMINIIIEPAALNSVTDICNWTIEFHSIMKYDGPIYSLLMAVIAISPAGYWHFRSGFPRDVGYRWTYYWSIIWKCVRRDENPIFKLQKYCNLDTDNLMSITQYIIVLIFDLLSSNHFVVLTIILQVVHCQWLWNIYTNSISYHDSLCTKVIGVYISNTSKLIYVWYFIEKLLYILYWTPKLFEYVYIYISLVGMFCVLVTRWQLHKEVLLIRSDTCHIDNF